MDVVDEDWDTLLILDACRYDTFAEVHNIPGTLESRISRGSCSAEFLAGNFGNRKCHDTVYVNANPFLEKLNLNSHFHDVVNLWKDEGWDDSLGTVHPETMNDYARQALEDYPNKRVIVHYMQPHYPFIGSDDSNEALNTAVDETAPWRKLFLGEAHIPVEKIESAYRENLELVLEHVTKILEVIDGRTVITSDHGNMLGERSFPLPVREWGHPAGHYIEPLVKVPWHVYERGERRRIISDQSVNREGRSYAEIKQKLQDLGYLPGA